MTIRQDKSSAGNGWIEIAAAGSPTHGYLSLPPQGSGPGVVIVAGGGTGPAVEKLCDTYAEEGYVALAVDGSRGLAAAVQTIRAHPRYAGKAAVVDYGEGGRCAWQAAVGGLVDSAVIFDAACADLLEAGSPPAVPVTLHLADGDPELSVVSRDHLATTLRSAGGALHVYPACRPGFALPGGSGYDPVQARMAQSRTIGALKQVMGPNFDLEALWDRHLACEFAARDADAAIETMVAEPYVNHIPTMTGGFGREMLRRFYRDHFVNQVPRDRRTIPISRTVGPDRVVEEKLFCFTHDTPIDWMLPGIAPTGRYVEIPIVGIVTFRGDKLVNEHIYWDQASVLVQIGLLDPVALPVSGRRQARKLLDPTLPSNAFISRWTTSDANGSETEQVER